MSNKEYAKESSIYEFMIILDFKLEIYRIFNSKSKSCFEIYLRELHQDSLIDLKFYISFTKKNHHIFPDSDLDDANIDTRLKRSTKTNRYMI